MPASKVDAMYKKYPDLLEELKAWGFKIDTLKSGSVVIEAWEGGKWGPQTKLLTELAEFSSNGSGSKWSGEDGDTWSYEVFGGKSVAIDLEYEGKEVHKAFLALLAKYPEEATPLLESKSVWVASAARETLEG